MRERRNPPLCSQLKTDTPRPRYFAKSSFLLWNLDRYSIATEGPIRINGGAGRSRGGTKGATTETRPLDGGYIWNLGRLHDGAYAQLTIPSSSTPHASRAMLSGFGWG